MYSLGFSYLDISTAASLQHIFWRLSQKKICVLCSHLVIFGFFCIHRCLADDEILSIVSQLMMGKAYPSLVDFDNHLDELHLDWLNPEINRVVDNATNQIQE